MADEAEDVLELDDALEIDEIEGDAEPEQDNEAASDDEDGEGETFIGFEGEEEDEAAPASESESSVIRELRRANREAQRELAELRRAQQPAKIERRPEPTLESCEYDEDRFKRETREWLAHEAKVEAQEREAEEARKATQAEWEARAKAYEADKSALGVAGYDEAEAEVFSVLPREIQALILRTDKPAALVFALHRSPSKLETLSKLNLADAALQLGEWKAGLKVMKRKAPNPDRPIKGKSAASSAKTLERLEREAARTGDRTALIRYRKQMNAKA